MASLSKTQQKETVVAPSISDLVDNAASILVDPARLGDGVKDEPFANLYYRRFRKDPKSARRLLNYQGLVADGQPFNKGFVPPEFLDQVEESYEDLQSAAFEEFLLGRDVTEKTKILELFPNIRELRKEHTMEKAAQVKRLVDLYYEGPISVQNYETIFLLENALFPDSVIDAAKTLIETAPKTPKTVWVPSLWSVADEILNPVASATLTKTKDSAGVMFGQKKRDLTTSRNPKISLSSMFQVNPKTK